MMAGSKIGVMDATNNFADNGDCDGDGWVEPREWLDDGGAAGPDGVTGSNGGGYIPNKLGVSKTDPYGTQYAYCAWNSGADTVGDDADCDNDNITRPADAIAGDGTERRLIGDPVDTGEPIMVIYSAGPNRIYESPCRNFVDTTPNDGEPDSPLFEKGGDDIVMQYTYSEASASAGTAGLWELKTGVAGVATSNKAVELKMALGGTGASKSEVTICGSLTDIGRMRFNDFTQSIEACVDPLDSDPLKNYWEPVSGGPSAAESLVSDNSTACTTTDVAPNDGEPDDNGKIRFNPTLDRAEMCEGGAWREIILGSTAASLVITPVEKLDFTLNSDTASPRHSDWQTFTIENKGSAASEAIAMVIANTAYFEKGTDNCSGNILDASGGASPTCTFNVRFKSFNDGEYNGSLTVDINNKPVLALRGLSSGTCAAGSLVGGGVLAHCEDSYNLIAMNGGCNDDVTEPTCSGSLDSITSLFITAGTDQHYNATDYIDGRNNAVLYLTDSTVTWGPVKWCDDLVLNGFDDWYLPAKNEFQKIIELNAADSSKIPGIANGTYYTSTESHYISTGEIYHVNASDLSTWGRQLKTYGEVRRWRCVRRDTGGAATAPPPTASTKPGYLVLSKGKWDGDLQAAGGLADYIAAANKLCFDDLINNDWKGRNNTVLNTDTVKAFICKGTNCGDLAPDTRYFFANSGSAGLGGAFIDADYKGRGPGNSINWSGTNYFGSVTDYWTGRYAAGSDEMYLNDTYWGTDTLSSSEHFNCDSWVDKNTKKGVIGSSNSINIERWTSPASSCAVPRHLICMVHPSDGTPTPPPPEKITKPGFFVVTKDQWNGDLVTASGLTTPTAKEAADELCYNDLLDNNWKNRGQAVIERTNVEAFIAWGWGGNANNALPSATYYFSKSGDASVGGAYFETDSNGLGPDNNYPWYALNYFGSITEYWTGRYSGTSTKWPGGGAGAGTSECNLWSDATNAKTGYHGNTNSTDKQRWSPTAGVGDDCSTTKHLICMVHPSEATPTAPLPDPLANGLGHFVITKNKWDGDLPTAANNEGLGTFPNGWEAARALCIDDLTNNIWDGRAGAVLNNSTVRPWLCGAGSASCNHKPSTRYNFASSGYEHGATMGHFDSTATGVGIGDNNSWAATNYFNGVKEYWSGRGNTGSNQTWSTGSWSNASKNCNAYEDNGTPTPDGIMGISNSTGATRWTNTAQNCSTPRHLVCIVDPSTDAVTAQPTPPAHTYKIPGAYTVTIDAGQTVTFKAWGGAGGGGGGSDDVGDYRLGGNGGGGGYAEATVTPTADTTYYIYVGGGGYPGSSSSESGGNGGASYTGSAGGTGGGQNSLSSPLIGTGGGGGGSTVIFATVSDGTRIVGAGGGGGGAGSGDTCNAQSGQASPTGPKLMNSNNGGNGMQASAISSGTGGGSGGGYEVSTGKSQGAGYNNSRCTAGGGAGGNSYSITSIETSGAGDLPANIVEPYYPTGSAKGGAGEDPSTSTPGTQGGNGLVLIYFN